MDNQELIRKVFELVKQELLRVYGDDMVECVKASGYVPEHCGECFDNRITYTQNKTKAEQCII